ncbi:hypothetical protein [Aestuariivirga sp.]|uniref:hypothetical protein n=1 Tax=Aestuariivirga sp. TaxID=2650926 RepID=UPI003BAC859D
MAKLMWICGILLSAAGIAIGVIVLVGPAQTGFASLDAAAILLVGGILAVGLGGVIDGLHRLPLEQGDVYVAAPPPAAAPAASAAPIPEFGPRVGKAAAAAVAATSMPEVSEPTRDTIQALEQARQKIEQAFDTKKPSPEPAAAPEPEPVLEEEEAIVEEVTIEEETVDDGQLYVVEERVIRSHPARVLSDGTVEAETGEGWMRFENLEHLDEYLDATEPAKG